MRKDQLAAGAASASYGPLSGVSQKQWEAIFGKPEIGMYKPKKTKKSTSRTSREGSAQSE